MKRMLKMALLAGAGLTLMATAGFAELEVRPVVDFKDIYYPPEFAKPQIAPEIPFDKVDPHWFKLPPSAPYGEDVDFGEVSAVTTNSKGHVFVLNRNDVRGNNFGGQATQVLEFDEKGNYVREIGHNIYGFSYGHGIRVDKDDNIWVVDKGADMVTKFDGVTGKQMMVLGRRAEASAPYWKSNPEDRGERPPEEGGFAAPTDVAWDSKGNIYVSDGYIHCRVAKFDPHGNWIGSFGKCGTGPGEFHTVHNVQIDKNDHVWVADRTNGRIQIFDTNGNYLRQVIINVPTKKYQPLMGHQYPSKYEAFTPDKKQNLEPRPGTPDALCQPHDNPNVMFVGDIYPGRVYKIDLSGKVLGYFGHVGKEWGNTGSIHGLACPSENLIYTAEFVNDRVERFVLHPEHAKVTGN
jgi:sugar lactone lactonase YvrE